LVVSREGLPVGYQVFAGNRNDVTTVEEVVESMEARYGKAKRVWVMDRGMVSEDILEWFREGGRGYLVGAARTELRKWKDPLSDPTGWKSVRDGLEVKYCKGPRGDEVFILYRSEKLAGSTAVCHRARGRTRTPLEAARRLEGASGVDELWKAYIQLSQGEDAFRIHKSQLGVRPIWHQREDRVQAHILVCFLAFAMWKTLEGCIKG
jgi:hypothetical protein